MISLAAIDVLDPLLRWSWPAALAVLTVLASVALRRVATSRPSGQRVTFQVVTIGISCVGLLAVVLTLPVDPETRGQLLGFLGIVSSAAIALSSTTILGNALAGMMLRLVRALRVGDFVRVEGTFGRVTERGIIHTELQTEDRDLTTLPNLYLVSHPLTIVRASGTILSTQVSLGYDVPRDRVEGALIAAAEEVGLEHPFVQILELGDFSVTYRIAGLLEEVQAMLSSRSKLNGAVLDALHGAGVEIVSPTFMNTRPVDGREFIPAPSRRREQPEEPEGDAPEAVIFDKADDVSAVAELEERLAIERERLGELPRDQEAAREAAEHAIATTERALEVLRARLEAERE